MRLQSEPAKKVEKGHRLARSTALAAAHHLSLSVARAWLMFHPDAMTFDASPANRNGFLKDSVAAARFRKCEDCYPLTYSF
jgi:hypothetical protein